MVEISASMVKALREATNAGMMDCKQALMATKGDIEAAMDWLRQKGIAKGSRRAEKIATDGLISIATRHTEGVILELNSQTDFVARNEEFQNLAQAVALQALEEKALKDELSPHEAVNILLAAPYPKGGTIQEAIAYVSTKLGETISLRRCNRLSVSEGVIGHYLHNVLNPGLGRLGVLVALKSPAEPEKLKDLQLFGKELAMHIAASNPLVLKEEDLDPALKQQEREVLEARNAGRSPQILEKILENGVKTYCREVCLLDQNYVHDNSLSVMAAIKAAAQNMGTSLEVTHFIRYAVGEGLDRPANDFAAEVAVASGVVK